MLRIFQITSNANPSRFLNYVYCLTGQCWQMGDRLPLNLSHGWEQLLRRKAAKDYPRKFILMTHIYCAFTTRQVLVNAFLPAIHLFNFKRTL